MCDFVAHDVAPLCVEFDVSFAADDAKGAMQPVIVVAAPQ